MSHIRDVQVMLKALIVTSIIMFISVFTGIPKILGVTLTAWIINIGWIMYLLLGYKTVDDLVEAHEKKIRKAKENKNYAEVSIRFIALPLCSIGVIVVFVNIALLFMM